MKKQAIALVVVVGVSMYFLVQSATSISIKAPVVDLDKSSLPSFKPPTLGTLGHQLITTVERPFAISKALATFEEYLNYARKHDLAGIKRLSYQISDTCADPKQEEACFALMDGVYAAWSGRMQSEFTKAWYDDKQIIISSEDLKSALFFTRDVRGNPLALGLCLDTTPSASFICVDPEPNKHDRDADGWWDEIESHFYKK